MSFKEFTARRMYDEFNRQYTREEVNEFIRWFVNELKQQVRTSPKVVIQEFGTFITTKLPDREVLNPGSGLKVQQPAHYKIKFRASKSTKALQA